MVVVHTLVAEAVFRSVAVFLDEAVSLEETVPPLQEEVELELELELGVASSNRAALPHCATFQSGSSRSVAPLMARRERRLWECRKRGSVNWWGSRKRGLGRVR